MAAKNQDSPVMITILGPTATGKTRLAAQVAQQVNGEIISADSRQVYRGMDIGTGKDYADYVVDGVKIPFHLVDIVDPGYEYSLFEFREDFGKAYAEIVNRQKQPILCGGTGLYLEAVISGYKMVKVPENTGLRGKLTGKTPDELNRILSEYRDVHNVTDSTDINRTIRAIEIEDYLKTHPGAQNDFPQIETMIFGIQFDRQIIRQRITERLKNRLETGMIEEVRNLLDAGLQPSQLSFYGLEYRFLTDFVTGKIAYNEMFTLLNTAIHQFAKRQMTWFRRMEKKGMTIHWIDGNQTVAEKVELVLSVFERGGRE
jgi:tRNA dimethylallyltransferase